VKELADLRAEHQKELRSGDIERQSNIRQVDITNADSSARQTQTAIEALASGVENTRKTLADAQSSLAARVDERLGALERSESLVRGTARVADPALSALTARVEQLVALQAVSAGKGEGADALWGYIVAAITLIISITGAFVIARRDTRAKSI
jgi:4-hydroxyphenylpyruvate dioxygenase-like putative hemolysin